MTVRRIGKLDSAGGREVYRGYIRALRDSDMKTLPRALKKAKKSPKVKLLTNSKSIVNVVTVNDISPV
jgi:hypothetical protein